MLLGGVKNISSLKGGGQNRIDPKNEPLSFNFVLGLKELKTTFLLLPGKKQFNFRRKIIDLSKSREIFRPQFENLFFTENFYKLEYNTVQ